MVGRVPDANTVERIVAERRSWNARTISLTLSLVGFAGTLFGFIAQIPVEHVVGMGATALVDLGAYGLTRMGRVRLGVYVLIVSIFAHHLLVVVATGQLQTVPYMAIVAILVGAATLRRRGLLMVGGLAMVVILAEGTITGYGRLEEVRTIGYVAGAMVLATLTVVLSYLHIRSTDRAFEVARDRELERERVRAEKEELAVELEKSRRIEGLGRLAGRVAHDFNNLLSGITGSADLALAELPEGHRARRDLDEVSRTAERAARLTQQLLALSRGQIVTPDPVDAAEEIADMKGLLSRLAGPGCALSCGLDACLPVAIDRSRLEQLLVNYVVNARDAMENGGRIEVRLALRRIEAGEVARLAAGVYAEVQVSDTGPGIPPDVVPRLFEPFFTTKKRGNGLGLATCYAIASQLGGTVMVSTRPGAGTTLTTLLPTARAIDAEPTESVPRVPGPVASGALVLVVDDEEPLRKVAARMLKRANLEVVTAADLTEARAVIEDPARPLAAVVLDVVLGAECGPDLLADLRRTSPGARIVVTSAFAPEHDVLEAVQAHGAEFLPKPYSRAALVRAVRGEPAVAQRVG